MAFCLRDVIASGFDLGFGDRADGLIEISILEHWRNVFHGAGDWRTPLYFHPYGDTLGYNDGYFLFGAVYSLLRLAFDPFWSDTLNALVFKSIGFFSAHALFRRGLGWRPNPALLAACLFSISNGLGLQSVHAQLQSIGLQPLFFLLVIRAWRAEVAEKRAAAILWAVGAAALLAAWLLTSFYMAWFALFFGGAFAAAWLWASGHRRPAAIWTLTRRHGAVFAAAGLAFAIFSAPFLWVYLPKVVETGAHPFGDAQNYLVMPLDPVNVGPRNLLWGWINRALLAVLPSKLVVDEHASGFPLAFFALFVLAMRQTLRRSGAVAPPASIPVRALALSILGTWLLTIQLGPVSPWRLIGPIVPGGNGLRTVVRYQLFLLLPALILVFEVLRERWEGLRIARPAAAFGLVALLVAENINLQSAADLSRSAQRAALAAIPPPPAACRSFFVVKARAGEGFYKKEIADRVYPHNVDAMLLAQLWRLPTVNGFSTFNPPDWDFASPRAPDYLARVGAYAARHDLHGLCGLDMRQSRPWTMLRP
ncbi:MAG: hypothetical protein JSR86_08685 [Proteobacteria bacterium]|nr:hypothetical protein [Pseudomonadota bacterium]